MARFEANFGRRPAGSPRKGQRPWAQPLAEFVDACIAPTLVKQGFGAGEIVLHWPAIVGPRLAAVCEPIRLQWPPRAKGGDTSRLSPATLVVRVEGAFAIELQHLGDVIIERANTHLGWRCVDRLALRQGPLQRPRRRRAGPRPPAPAGVERAEALTAGIEDDGLRAALTRLGAQIFSEDDGGGRKR